MEASDSEEEPIIEVQKGSGEGAAIVSHDFGKKTKPKQKEASDDGISDALCCGCWIILIILLLILLIVIIVACCKEPVGPFG